MSRTKIALSDYAEAHGISLAGAVKRAFAARYTLNTYSDPDAPAETDCDEGYAALTAYIDSSLVYLTVCRDAVRDDIVALREQALAAGDAFSMESFAASVCQQMPPVETKAWAEAIAAEWTDADEVTR